LPLSQEDVRCFSVQANRGVQSVFCINTWSFEPVVSSNSPLAYLRFSSRSYIPSHLLYNPNMKVTILFGLTVCLASIVNADADYSDKKAAPRLPLIQTDYKPIFAEEGKPCTTVKDCLFPVYHNCAGKSGCQPFVGSIHAVCKTDSDCQYGLSCKPDEGGKLLRCLETNPPRVNLDLGEGSNTCSSPSDCPYELCFYGVCRTQAGAQNAPCQNADWCQDGRKCVAGKRSSFCS
jgi:hypothetical protein